ncbi:hypothetical protein ROHU_023033 [Labeo rohita]|uniref:Uncharacterized protein n=1 Tax=Labeo rohita TaxID=84645 RepID=A0A498MP05_LABRO|nr:hypothetical protein ROHU_023033 [Labeo rohita]
MAALEEVQTLTDKPDAASLARPESDNSPQEKEVTGIYKGRRRDFRIPGGAATLLHINVKGPEDGIASVR